MKFYSKTAKGFFDSDIHGENIPSDAVEITDELHLSLLAWQCAGQIIAADDNGTPVLKVAPSLTDDQVKALQNADVIAQIKTVEAASLRSIREALVNGDLTRLKEIDAQISTLRSQIKP